MVPSERDNLLRWRGRPGAYEAYFLIFHDLARRAAYWLRYTLMAPLKGEAVVELWSNLFDGSAGKTVALKEAHPASRASFSPPPFRFAVGESELTHSSAKGRIRGAEGEMAWDLRWEPNRESFRPLPNIVYALPLPVARVASPNLDIRVSGTVAVNGDVREITSAPGHQTHHWGRRHAPGWAWGHCGAFREDPGALFEGFSVRPRAGSDRLLTILHFRVGGRSYTFNRLSDLRRTESRWDLGRWTFAARRGDVRFEGELTGAPERMVHLEYVDPDDSRLYCANTELADMRLKVERRAGSEWKLERELTAEGTACVEFTGRRPWQGVPLRG